MLTGKGTSCKKKIRYSLHREINFERDEDGMENLEEFLRENLVSSSFQEKGKEESKVKDYKTLARMAKIRQMPNYSV